MCSLMATICKTFCCKEYSNQTPNDLIKHVHFSRHSLDDTARVRRPTSFPDFDWHSTYIPGMDPSDELLYQVAVLVPDKEQSWQNLTTLWPEQPSDKSQYEATTMFSDEE